MICLIPNTNQIIKCTGNSVKYEGRFNPNYTDKQHQKANQMLNKKQNLHCKTILKKNEIKKSPNKNLNIENSDIIYLKLIYTVKNI